ncbi:hypothetical protein IKF02_04435 [Candidatus Saccharibacteria bacterium]|nr:hypothetical protein [Candidatus Saccharibacteria bacterium]
MIILEKMRIDTAGRIAIKDFLGDNPPKKVGVGYRIETREIIIVPWDDKCRLVCRSVDGKRRVNINQLCKLFDGDIYRVLDEDGIKKLMVLNLDEIPFGASNNRICER